MSANLRELVARFPITGRLEAIVLRPARNVEAVCSEEAQAIAGLGLVGDRRAGVPRHGEEARRREVTLVQAEHLPLIATWVGRASVDPRQLRRNLVVSGVNLLALSSPFPGQRLLWRIGAEVVVEATGPCAPCSRMETALGPGAYNAMRGHGGITARIVQGGWLRRGDPVAACTADKEAIRNSLG